MLNAKIQNSVGARHEVKALNTGGSVPTYHLPSSEADYLRVEASQKVRRKARVSGYRRLPNDADS